MSLILQIYAACVDVELHAAQVFNVTYRDVNAFLFFILWPALTVVLLGVVIWQAILLRRRP